MSAIGKWLSECGCCGRVQRPERVAAVRDVHREEFNVPFFADPEEEMRQWDRGSTEEGLPLNVSQQGWN